MSLTNNIHVTNNNLGHNKNEKNIYKNRSCFLMAEMTFTNWSPSSSQVHIGGDKSGEPEIFNIRMRTSSQDIVEDKLSFRIDKDDLGILIGFLMSLQRQTWK